MKIASYNIENLFLRAKALNMKTLEEGKVVVDQVNKLNNLLNKDKYSKADFRKMVDLLGELGMAKQDEGPFCILRQNRGKLLKRKKNGTIEFQVEGRSDWIGWVELTVEQVNEVATRNTARVIKDMNADVLAVVEAETRPSILRFNHDVIQAAVSRYKHCMLVDGNDDRGIDVGLMTKAGYPITSIESHVDDFDDDDAKFPIFSRDCAVFFVDTPAGNQLAVLANHFKSKIGGGDPKRKRQATQVATIYNELVARGINLIAVVGDLNDTPDSDPLSPLLQETDLADVSTHPAFDDGGHPGTYGACNASNKIDYILMSPALMAACTGGGIFRKGMWVNKNGDKFEHYAEVTKPGEAASDHAAIWAEVGV